MSERELHVSGPQDFITMSDKTNRIPPKGHPNRCRYWRDKRILQQLEQEAIEVNFAVEDSKNIKQQAYFKLCLKDMQSAINNFKAGWLEKYNT